MNLVDTMGGDATILAAGMGYTVEHAYQEIEKSPAFVTQTFREWARGSNNTVRYKATLRQPFETAVALFELEMGWGCLAHVQKMSNLADHSPLTLPGDVSDTPKGFYSEKDQTKFVGSSTEIELSAEANVEISRKNVLDVVREGVDYPSASSFSSGHAARPLLASINLMEAHDAYSRAVVFGQLSRQAKDAISEMRKAFERVAPLASEALYGGTIGY